ncbi:MAG: potassium transporter TrkA, partial [Methanoregulaceae archaeon]|nr:potassium transporter TrkA [Methanoregulaceae archaeon]
LPVIGGQLIASIILSEIVTIILDLPNRQKVVKKRMTRNAGQTVSWVQNRSGAWIIGIETGGQSHVHPDPGETIGEGDVVFAIGEPEQIKKFIRIL